MKLRKMFVCSGLFILALCLTLSVTAGEKKQKETKKKVISLTQKEVVKCIQVLPLFMKEFPAFNPLTGTGAKATGKPNMTGLVSGANLNKLNAFATKNGYADFKDFAEDFSGVIAGYMYYKTKDAQKMLQEQLKALPPEAAGLFQAQLSPINDTVNKLKATVTPEVLKAIKPHMAAMDKIMGLP